MPTSDNRNLDKSLQEIYNAVKIGEEDLHAASAQMQNRGQKYLFKRFAQRHRRIARELADLMHQLGFHVDDVGRFRNALKRGWMLIRIAMIVPRANRQAGAAQKSAAGESRLLEHYDAALAGPLPDPARTLLQRQRDGLAAIRRWLRRIVDQEHFIVRLYDDTDTAAQTVRELTAAGFAEEQIEVTPLRQTMLYRGDAEERGEFIFDAILVASLLLGALGTAIGLFAGYAVPHVVPEVPRTTGEIWFSTLTWGLQGLGAGVFIGIVFGYLLGRGLSEDDAALVRALANPDAVVVSVSTSADNHDEAARILDIRHERELATEPVWEYGPRVGRPI